MQSGKLRHRITIQQPTNTAGSMGQVTTTWSDLATVWASVEPLSGSERWRAQQVQPGVSHKVTLRYLAGVTPAMRVQHGTRYLNIDSVLNTEERNVELVLNCVEQQ